MLVTRLTSIFAELSNSDWRFKKASPEQSIASKFKLYLRWAQCNTPCRHPLKAGRSLLKKLGLMWRNV